MKKKMSRIVLVAGALLAVAALAAAAETSVIVKLGETKKIDGGKAQVKFVSVKSDTRCPENVTCISAGDAVILVEVAHGGTTLAEPELHINTDPREIEVAGGKLYFDSLSPKQAKGNTEYVAGFKFTK